MPLNLGRRAVGTVVILAAVYFVAAKLGLSLAFFHPSATPVWPPTGIALAALLIVGYRAGPGIFLGALLANLTTYGTVWTSLGIATGNTLEGLVGAYLVNRYANGRNLFDHPWDIFKFAIVAAGVSTTVSATIGVTSLALANFAPWTDYRQIWLTWWLGDAAGALIFAPLIVLWVNKPYLHWAGQAIFERTIFVPALLAVSWIVFRGLFPFIYLTVPLLVWAAFRFDQRETAAVIVLLTVIAVWATIRQIGPFVGATPNESLLLLQAFMGIMAMVALPLASVVAERKATDQKAESFSLQLQHQNALLESRVRERTQVLEETQARFRGILESAPDGMVIVDDRGNMMLANGQLERLFGYTREELVGAPVEILIPERFRDVHQRHRADYTKAPRTRPMGAGLDLYGRRKDGSEFPVEVSLSPLQTPEGMLAIAAIRDVSERRQAEERDLQRLQTLSALYVSAQKLSQSLDQVELADYIVSTAVKAFGISLAWVGRAEPDGAIRVLAHYPTDDPYPSRLSIRWDDSPDGQGPSGRAIRTGFPVVMDAGSAGQMLPPDRAAAFRGRGHGSTASIPLVSRNRPFGLLAVYSEKADFFTPARIELFQAFAHLAASALENARLLSETQQRADQFAALSDTARAATAQLDLSALLEAVLDRAMNLLRVPAAGIYLYDAARNDLELTVARGMPAPVGTRLRRGEGVSGKVAETREPLVVDNYQTWEGRAATYGGIPVAAVAGVPLIYHGELIGVLFLGELGASNRRFSDADVNLLTLFASHVAGAVRSAKLFAAATRRMEHLQALRDIDVAITGTMDLQVALSVLLDKVTTQLHVDAAGVLLLNPQTQALEFSAGRGFRTVALQHTPLRLGRGAAGRAALERRLITIPDLSQTSGEPHAAPLPPEEGFVGYLAVPLISKGQVLGVMEVFHRGLLQPDQEWLDFLTTLSGQAALAIDNAMLLTNLQRANVDLTLAYDVTLEGWSRALDLRDRETEGHTQRVTDLTLRLAGAMGVPEDEMAHIRRGALLHDIGKMGIPDAILLKPGPLTDGEWAIMKKHPVAAHELLAPIAYLRPALDIPRYHHEKWDGTGYPEGLHSEQIPLAARIFAVADVYDALTSDRPYRAAWTREKAREYIREQAGKHFDPRVVETFLHLDASRTVPEAASPGSG